MADIAFETKQEIPLVRIQQESGSYSESAYKMRRLSEFRTDPAIKIEQAELESYLAEVGGAKGISVADLLEPQQLSLPLYIGATTPKATSEVPHWHTDQTEAYVVVYGEATMLAKYRWAVSWTSTIARRGDLLIVHPEACHWFVWRSATGLALVFKAPQRAGIGKFPAGKITCNFCPHYQRTCRLPEGFIPSA